MRPVFFLTAALACVQNLDRTDSGDTAAGDVEPTLLDAAAGAVEDGTTLHLNDVVVSTLATTDGGSFFIQSLGGGAGMRVDLAYPGSVDWVRPGDTLNLIGVLDTTAGSAVLDVWEPDWISRTGAVEPPAPAALSLDGPPRAADAGRLVRLSGITTAGCPDAVGNVSLTEALLLVDRLAPVGALDDGASIATLDGVLVQISARWELWVVSMSGISGGAACP